jgi:DNA-binding NarL/FixJ family response regulator
MPATLTRIILADQQLIFRQGLAAILAEGGWTVAAQIGDLDALEQALQHQPPDILIIDRAIPRSDIFLYCRSITTMYSNMQVLILTPYEHESREMQVQALRAGAAGCLSKDHAADRYLDAMFVLADQRVLFSHAVIRLALATAEDAAEHTPPQLHNKALRGLTKRELEILKLVSQGLGNPDIAQALRIADNTVMKHMTHLMSKLGARNRTEAGFIYLHASTPADGDLPQSGRVST